jgi:hypothetical protein
MTNNLTSAIDKLGMLKAAIADLEREEKELCKVLIENGAGSYDGELFRATVSKFTRETLDMTAVREKLTPQFIRAHTNKTPMAQVRVTARKAA